MIKASPLWKDKPALAAPLIGRLNSASDPTATVGPLIPNASDALSSTKNRRDCVCHHSAGPHLLEAEVWGNFEAADGDLMKRSCEGFNDCYESALMFWGGVAASHFRLLNSPRCCEHVSDLPDSCSRPLIALPCLPPCRSRGWGSSLVAHSPSSLTSKTSLRLPTSTFATETAFLLLLLFIL